MRYFPLLDFQHTVLALGLGLVALIFAIAGWGSYRRREGSSVEEPEGGGVPRTDDNPVPPLLVFVYTGIAVWALGYAAFVWFRGLPVGY